VGIKRRTALTAMLAGAAGLAGAKRAKAAEAVVAQVDARGLLYDTTLCIGCKACVSACRAANNLEADPGFAPGLYHAPADLSARAKTVIKLYQDGSERSFVKAQCMHCVDPACAGACMLGALSKREYGIVSYNPDLCVGCRYCQMACAFNVPKFEWAKRYTPRIVKCELCRHLIAEGKTPACADVCPRGAVIYETRAELLAEAKARIAANPGKYIDKVYGEHEAGGTQVLYLSHVPFEKLGLPAIGPESVPARARSVQHAVYRGFIAPTVLYAVLGFVTFRNRKNRAPRREEEQP
jgi:Fe-S-cluster-containing dehydrogenase component